LLKEYCQKTDKAFIARVALSEQVNQNNSTDKICIFYQRRNALPNDNLASVKCFQDAFFVFCNGI
jgi:hypothetical protein